jgi:hypothetical protein
MSPSSFCSHSDHGAVHPPDAPRAAGEDLEHPIGRQLPDDSSLLDLQADILDRHGITDQLVGLDTQEDAVWLRLLLQPLGEVGGVADDLLLDRLAGAH